MKRLNLDQKNNALMLHIFKCQMAQGIQEYTE